MTTLSFIITGKYVSRYFIQMYSNLWKAYVYSDYCYSVYCAIVINKLNQSLLALVQACVFVFSLL